LIDWKGRYDGSVPDKYFFPLEEIQQRRPELLCEYLISKFKNKLDKRRAKIEIINN